MHKKWTLVFSFSSRRAPTANNPSMGRRRPFSSEDDPFLLYAALNSGNHCLIVSRDLMRDHKASLSDALTRRLFFKWQRGHQMEVFGLMSPVQKVRFKVRREQRRGEGRSEEERGEGERERREERKGGEVRRRWGRGGCTFT